MERYQEDCAEFRDLKKASEAHCIPDIDVLEPVMRRVTALEKARPPIWQRIYTLPFKGMTTTGLVITFLLISFTAYAASEYIQILNKEGQVKVQYVPESLEEVEDINGNYGMKAYVEAEPGELVAYYIKNNINSDNNNPELHFTYKERRIEQYPAFASEINRTGAPRLPQAPLGYTFKYGNVYASSPTYREVTSSSYYKGILNQLMDEASQDISGKIVFVKALPWSKPSSASAKYSSGRSYINISAVLLHGSHVTVNQEAENRASIVNVSGTDVVYNDVHKEEVQYDYINWYDEEQDAYFTISAYGEKDLNKEQLLQLAKEMLE